MEYKHAIGPEAELDLSLDKGKLTIVVKHVGASGAEGITVEEDLGYFIDKLVALLPDGTLKNILGPAAALAKGALQSV